MIRRLIRDESGQAMAEYGLIAGAVALGLYVTCQGLRVLQGQVYDHQHSALREWKSP
jgi:Flp pilus assembly pilin Flp